MQMHAHENRNCAPGGGVKVSLSAWEGVEVFSHLRPNFHDPKPPHDILNNHFLTVWQLTMLTVCTEYWFIVDNTHLKIKVY